MVFKGTLLNNRHKNVIWLNKKDNKILLTLFLSNIKILFKRIEIRK
jgi:hypothetical protein